MDLVCFPSLARNTDRESEGQPESQALQRPLFPHHKNHKAFTSPVLDQQDTVKYGITTGPYRENNGGKD